MKDLRWELPSFRAILSAASQFLSGPSTPRQIDVTVVPHGAMCHRRLFDFPLEICQEFLFRPLLIELSVIQPSYYLGVGSKPSVATHVGCEADDPNASALHAYDRALRFLATGSKEAGRDPIIAHPELYRSSFVAVPLSEGNTDGHPSSQALPPEPWDSFATYSWEYERGTGSVDITRQVSRLGERFLKILSSDPAVSEGVYGNFASSYLLVVPLLRPDASAPLSGSRRVNGDPTKPPARLQSAGGALFLVLRSTQGGRPHKVERPLRDLAVYLQRELLLSALGESHGEVALQRRRVELYEEIGHTLKTMIQITGWWNKEQSLRRLASKLETEGTRVVLQAANALALFAPVQALGDLIRLVGILGRRRPQDFQKISDWVDPLLLAAWMDAREGTILEAAADAFFQLARVYCMATGWPALNLVVSYQGGVKEERAWVDSPEEPQEGLELSDLCIPPFVRGSDALFAVIPVITEPVANAVRYLKAREFAEVPPLRLRLSSCLPESIIVEIGNVFTLSAPPPERLPRGLELASELLKEADLCSFAEPFTDSDDYYWIPIHFHPHRLALRIHEVTHGPRTP